MQMRETSIAGCWVFSPKVHLDGRGLFLESFTQQSFLKTVGHDLRVRQFNVSLSRQGTIRGIHFAEVPPGQAKYVQCFTGAVLDVVVDLRIGSPTFGEWEAVKLDSDSRNAIYLTEGLGHAFCALSEDTTIGYMCSEPYAPDREHGIHPLDSELAIAWPQDFELLLSAKDAAAPSLSEALSLGILPTYDNCRRQRAALGNRGSS